MPLTVALHCSMVRSHNLYRRHRFLPNSPRTMDSDRKAERSRVRLTVLPAPVMQLTEKLS